MGWKSESTKEAGCLRRRAAAFLWFQSQERETSCKYYAYRMRLLVWKSLSSACNCSWCERGAGIKDSSQDVDCAQVCWFMVAMAAVAPLTIYSLPSERGSSVRHPAVLPAQPIIWCLELAKCSAHHLCCRLLVLLWSTSGSSTGRKRS